MTHGLPAHPLDDVRACAARIETATAIRHEVAALHMQPAAVEVIDEHIARLKLRAAATQTAAHALLADEE